MTFGMTLPTASVVMANVKNIRHVSQRISFKLFALVTMAQTVTWGAIVCTTRRVATGRSARDLA